MYTVYINILLVPPGFIQGNTLEASFVHEFLRDGHPKKIHRGYGEMSGIPMASHWSIGGLPEKNPGIFSPNIPICQVFSWFSCVLYPREECIQCLQYSETRNHLPPTLVLPLLVCRLGFTPCFPGKGRCWQRLRGRGFWTQTVCKLCSCFLESRVHFSLGFCCRDALILWFDVFFSGCCCFTSRGHRPKRCRVPGLWDFLSQGIKWWWVTFLTVYVFNVFKGIDVP